jgi:hypothetical protein
MDRETPDPEAEASHPSGKQSISREDAETVDERPTRADGDNDDEGALK